MSRARRLSGNSRSVSLRTCKRLGGAKANKTDLECGTDKRFLPAIPLLGQYGSCFLVALGVANQSGTGSHGYLCRFTT